MNVTGTCGRLLLRKLHSSSCVQLCRGRFLSSLPSRHWSNNTSPPPPLSANYWTLHELVCSSQYEKAIDVWESSKAHGQLDRDSYAVVMAMCERLGSGEAALAVRKDMRNQGWIMDEMCSLSFINALLTDGMVAEAFEQEHSSLQQDDSFLTQVAKSFFKNGHPELACKVCQLYPGHSDSLLSVQLEALGSIQQVENMEQLVEKHHGGVSESPLSVQVAFVNGLSLTDQYNRAIDLLTTVIERCTDMLSLKSVSLLLESVKRAEDTDAAVRVYTLFWKQACSLKVSEVSDNFLQTTLSALESERSSYLIRAINASIHLQALILKEQESPIIQNGHVKFRKEQSTSVATIEEEERIFLEHDFYSTLRSQSVYPDRQTYEALLLKACFDENSADVADRSIKTCFQAGSPLTSSSFTEWTRHCGQLAPSQALRVLSLIKRHYLARYHIPLDVSDYKRLLGVSLVCGDDHEIKSQALQYIRTIKNSMQSQGLLSDVENWNEIILALTRLGAGEGPLFVTFDDMTAKNVQPVLETYKIIVSAAVNGSKRNTLTAVFDWWRLFNSRVKPDVQLINKLIECCSQCEEYERGFFFFGLLKDYELQPDIETFHSLFKICAITTDKDRLNTLASLAKSVLPSHTDSISTTVSDIRMSWNEISTQPQTENQE